MATITICSDFGALKNKVSHCFPIYLLCVFQAHINYILNTYRAKNSQNKGNCVKSLKEKKKYWNGQPFPSPRVPPNPGIEPRSHALQVDSLSAETQGKPKNTEVGSLSLLQGSPQPRNQATQESNWGLLHCRQILYHLSHQRTLPIV